MEAAYRRDGDNWDMVHALIILGGGAMVVAGVLTTSDVAMGVVGLTLHAVLLLGFTTSFLRRRWHALSALSRPTTPLGDVVGASERDVVVHGHLEALPDDRGWLLRCPDSPGVVGWIDTIELETWRANERGRWARMPGDTGPRDAEVVVAATAGPCEDIPQALLDGLALGGYREPPHVVRLTGSRRAPVRIGALASKPAQPLVRVAIDAVEPSEADAEGCDVDRGAGVVGERAEHRLQRE